MGGGGGLQITVKYISRSMSTSHRKITLLYENCDREKAWSRWSIRYRQPLWELTSDCHLLWLNNTFYVGRANDLLSSTGEINPSLTLSVLMLGGKSDKGNGAEWEKEESLTHLLTWWSTAAICLYLRRLRDGRGPLTNRGQQSASKPTRPVRWKTRPPGSQHSTIHAVYMSPHKYWLHTHAISEL